MKVKVNVGDWGRWHATGTMAKLEEIIKVNKQEVSK
jgi:hypothetical protein